MMDFDVARLWPIFWAAIGAALMAALLGLLGPHNASLSGVEGGLKQKVEAALAKAGAKHVSVEMDGQTARLIGAAPTQAARTAAIDIALTAAGPGGAWAGGVSNVDAEDLVVGAPVSPYTWRAVRRGNVITLSGHAPTPRVKERLLAAARGAFAGAEVQDSMRIAPGAPDAGWSDVAAEAVAQLGHLRRGEARMTDGLLILFGDGDAASVDRVRAEYRNGLAAPYRARVEVSTTGDGLDLADLGEIDLTDAGADTCQQAFGRMMERNVINFSSGSSEIDRSSLRLLDQLASIALRCDMFSIEIAGHTDNVGARDANLALSQRRASSVASYLISQGVARERLAAVGYGPDRPRRSNATPVGQAANRRIEFSVKE